MALRSINPATGELIREYDEMTRDQVQHIVEQSHQAYLSWRAVPIRERAATMKQAASVLEEGEKLMAELAAREMGKAVREARSEVKKCAWVCNYFAENAGRFLAEEPIETDASRSFVTFRPLGVILGVMPWNFPYWQAFRYAVPALMAGNVCLLKHASNVCGCALAMERIFRDAGFPENAFRSVLVGSGEVESIIENPRVRAVSLTGSTGAGKAVAAKASEMLKKTVLELGGSDPYVVLEDADLESAVEICASSRLINAGQSCIAAKRFIVVEPVRKEFEERFAERMQAVRMGDPLREDTDMGPLARHDLRDDLHRQVIESIDQGARCLAGGKVPEGPGAFYPPTVLTDVSKGSPAYSEETFGPVAAIIPVRDEQEAVRTANDTGYGLGAAVFTRDLEKGERIVADELDAGNCFVNGFVRSDPRLPFGGVKDSGYGRELSIYGIREFVNVKTVYIA
jgi:succinate-semialdehyde dehydrogenase/glutarate-semialdehyde dehydrogenase